MSRASRLVLAAGLTLAGCAPSRSFSAGVFRDRDTSYRVGVLPVAWRPLSISQGDLAFEHPRGGTIYADSTCRDSTEDLPLDVLTNHLLFDVVVRRELSKETLTLDGRRALRTHLLGELDGVPVELDLVVLQKDGCVYDLVLIAAAGAFPSRRPDFEGFVLGFETLGSA